MNSFVGIDHFFILCMACGNMTCAGVGLWTPMSWYSFLVIRCSMFSVACLVEGFRGLLGMEFDVVGSFWCGI